MKRVLRAAAMVLLAGLNLVGSAQRAQADSVCYVSWEKPQWPSELEGTYCQDSEGNVFAELEFQEQPNTVVGAVADVNDKCATLLVCSFTWFQTTEWLNENQNTDYWWVEEIPDEIRVQCSCTRN